MTKTKTRINEAVLNELLFQIHCAAFQVIDDTLNFNLEKRRVFWIQDKHLPKLIPAIDEAVKDALSEEYEWE